MTAKRKTKAQREIAERAALRRRVTDIANGAAGYPFDKEDEFATAEFLEKFIGGLKAAFETEQNDYLFKHHCLGRFHNIDTTTQFLWEHGVRA